MTPDVLLGLSLGAGLGAANVLASYGLYRFARLRSDRAFYAIVLLGMLGRMGVALVATAGILAFLPVHVLLFISALFLSVGAGLAVETVLISKDAASLARRTAASPTASL